MIAARRSSFTMTKKTARRQAAQSQHTGDRGTSNEDDGGSSGPNRPRNLLIMDATQPFTFAFQGRFALYKSILVHQTADEETWPGGALWDLGLLLSEVVVGLSAIRKPVHVTLTTSIEPNKSRGLNRSIELPNRVWTEPLINRLKDLETSGLVLELGAGVGLTGLIASSAFNAKLTVITDLEIVVDKVTQPNLILNSTVLSSNKTRQINKGTGRVIAMPLCWGDIEDEERVAETFSAAEAIADTPPSSRRKSKASKYVPKQGDQANSSGLPSLILIGDVAYQHRPGAPSHFDALLSTLLKFTGPRTLVLFGTRIRMPASNDLLNMFMDHFVDLVQPPLVADEIDPSFEGLKHNMSIHFLQRKA